MASKRRKEADRKQAKRQELAAAEDLTHIPITCTPTKHSFYNAPLNTISHTIIKYLTNLQENDVVARPSNWSCILHDYSVCQKNNLSLSSREKSKSVPKDHPWNHLALNHYSVANTEDEFEALLDSGLRLPVLILPESEFSTRIQRQSTWFGEPLNRLLDEIIGDSQDTIEVQYHAKSSLDEFTLTKKCQEVRNRFNIPLPDRGCPWNYLEIRDQLSGFKGPRSLQNGGKLLHWQMTNPEDHRRKRYGYTPIEGAKAVDQWLLVSEKHSGSTAHVDVGFAAWVSCLAGKKTFWVRNPLFED